MAGRAFPAEFIQELRSASDIVSVVSEYVRLKKVGNNYVGLCPFHNEDTPSFSVNREKQMFYCFGCNVGGDVFEFIKQREKVDFPEAVRLLAQRAHLPLPMRTAEETRRMGEREKLYRANALAQEYFQTQLLGKSGEVARSYLSRRGIDPAVAQDFGLGFALPDWQGLLDYLRRAGVSTDVAVKAGLAIPRQRGGGAYDRFRNRLMFPIRDLRGRVVAFGGRILGPGEPKYLNSPETLIYQKSRVLYALERARASIEKENRALIVEGYLDALTCHQFGFTWAVASLGTALTREQIDLIKRFTDKVYIGYDADAAGQAATQRGLALVRSAGLGVRVLQVPVGKDPDEFLKSAGADAFAVLVKEALPLPDYQYQRLVAEYGRETLEGRVAIARGMVPVLLGIDSLVEREEYTRKVAQELGLSMEALAAEIRRAARPITEDKAAAASNVKRNPLIPAARRAEAKALAGLCRLFLTNPEVREKIVARVTAEKLGDLPQAEVLATLLTLYRQGEREFSFPQVGECLDSAGAQEFLAQMAVVQQPTGDPQKLADDYLRFLERLWVEAEIQQVRREIISLNREGKNEASANLIRRLTALLQRANSLKQPGQMSISPGGRKEGGTRHAEKG